MSKIIKVVGVGDGPERRTYVEGGPACNGDGNAFLDCKGTGRFTISPGAPADPTINKIGVDEPCCICHGTGVQAVELWPDAELDRWLAEHFETWDLRMRRELHTNEPTYFVEGEPFIINPPGSDTSRGAKVAAVIAVAEVDNAD